MHPYEHSAAKEYIICNNNMIIGYLVLAFSISLDINEE